MIPTAEMPDEILPLAILMIEEEIIEARDEADIYALAARWFKLSRELQKRKDGR